MDFFVLSFVFESCWLNGGHDELIDRVNARMSALTGLNLETAEDFQVFILFLSYFPLAFHFFSSSLSVKNRIAERILAL